jgi:hypothetical protein
MGLLRISCVGTVVSLLLLRVSMSKTSHEAFVNFMASMLATSWKETM